jgi:hypothetical protein
VLGDAVNVAARLESAAAPGEVLLGELTHRLARGVLDAERLELSLLVEALTANAIMSANNLEPQIWWRTAAALASAGMGDQQGAERQGRAALAVARPTQAPLMLGDALACLGEVLLQRGALSEGRASLREAIDVYEAKGVNAAAAAARALIDSHADARAVL